MTQTNLLELAKQGDPQAIAILMNRSLQPRGMTAAVELQGNCLHVALEAEQVPNRQALTAFVQNGIGNLGIKSIQSIKVVGRQVGASIPAWVHEIILDASAASDPASTENLPSVETDLLPSAMPLPLRPTPPPIPPPIAPFQPTTPPVADAAAVLPTEQPASALDSAVEDASEFQFESLEPENLGLDDLDFEEFDEAAIAPMSNADFGFPEDSELEEAIANDFGVSEATGRDGIIDDNAFDDSAFTSSLDELGLEALDNELNSAELDSTDLNFAEFDSAELDNAELDSADLSFAELDSAELDSADLDFTEFDQGAIANSLNQFESFDQFEPLEPDATDLASLKDSDFGDEFNATKLEQEHPQTGSQPHNTDDLLASLDFEDGLDLDGIDLTNELNLTSELNVLPDVSEPTPNLGSTIDFERDLSFADHLPTDSEIPTDPLLDLAFDDAFDEDAFNFGNGLDTPPLSNEVSDLSDQFSDLSDLSDGFNDGPAQVEVDPLAAFDLEDSLGFEPGDQGTAETALDPLAGLALEDELQFDNELGEAVLGESVSGEASLDAASWNFDADPVSDSWLTEDTNPDVSDLEISNSENLITELPTTDIPVDASGAIASTDEFNWANELLPDPLAASPTAPPTDEPDHDPMAGFDLEDDLSFSADFPSISSVQPNAQPNEDSLPNLETSASFDFNDLQDALDQDALGTVELIDSPDDDLPPELLVDDIATPGLYPPPYDIDDLNANYNDADSDPDFASDLDAEDEEETLDWMTESSAELLFDTFPEGAEPSGAETWGQPAVPEPTLEGFATTTRPDFYLDTDPPGNALEPDEEEGTLNLTEESYAVDEPFQFLPDPDVEFRAEDFRTEDFRTEDFRTEDTTAPLELFSREEEPTDPFGGQAEEALPWADIQTESDAMPAPGYFREDEAPTPEQPLLIEEADPLALSLEPTTDQNFDWDAEAAVDSAPEVSPHSSSRLNSLTSSILLFLIGWIALLIGYSLWTNLTAPPPPPAGVPQQSDLSPANPIGTIVSPISPTNPENQSAPPPAP